MMRSLFRSALLVSVLSTLPSALQAQSMPQGWRVRADDPAANVADLAFQTMPPGWHITTGPTVILYHPDSAATGNYRIEAQVFLFDPGPRREGFGLFFGGRDLESAEQRYSYFLIRQDGQFTVKRRQGADAPTVQAWTASSALKKWADHGEDAAVGNVLAVDVGPDAVVFALNGTEVHSMPRAQLDTEGVIGVRVSHALNLHVARLEITKK